MADRRRWPALALLILVALAVSPPAAWAQEDGKEDGKRVYETVCAACHQVNGAGLPGLFPPLAGNPNVQDAEYLRSVIVNGKQGEIEVLGQTYNGVMPAQALSDAEIDAVIGYVQTGFAVTGSTTSTTAGSTQTLPAGEQAFLDAADTGRGLFLGSVAFANGGPSCFSCHSAGDQGALGGSSLGPDLTDAFGRYGGRDGLVSALGVSHGNLMTALYQDRPLTDLEIVELAAFLEVASGESDADFLDGLLVLGVAGLVALLAWVALIRSGRSEREEAAG